MTDTFKTESRGALLEGDRYLALLAIVLLGYALMGKGFAYLGFPPLYVGEIAFLGGIVVFLRTGAFVGVAGDAAGRLAGRADGLGPRAHAPVLWLVRVRFAARQRHRHLWRLCLYRHWSVARGCAPDQHRASLLRDHAGELSRHICGLLAHQVLGGVHPAAVRSGADRGYRAERGRNASWRAPWSSS